MRMLPTLSVRQPFAWAMLHAGKSVENRSWALPAKYVGCPVLLHASKKYDWDGHIFMYRTLDLESSVSQTDVTAPMGGIVGVIQFGGMTCSSKSQWAEQGKKHWLIESARPLPFFPCPGQLHFFQVPYPHNVKPFTTREVISHE